MKTRTGILLDSAFYVERPPIEADCYETILQSGALIRIKAPRQMGKTSLLTRILHQAREQGYQTAYLNFQSADAESFTSLDKFLQWFCDSIFPSIDVKEVINECLKITYERNTSAAIRELRQKLTNEN